MTQAEGRFPSTVKRGRKQAAEEVKNWALTDASPARNITMSQEDSAQAQMSFTNPTPEDRGV